MTENTLERFGNPGQNDWNLSLFDYSTITPLPPTPQRVTEIYQVLMIVPPTIRHHPTGTRAHWQLSCLCTPPCANTTSLSLNGCSSFRRCECIASPETPEVIIREFRQLCRIYFQIFQERHKGFQNPGSITTTN